ncbi:hypothetical protein B0H16DRAFT_1238326, partial [Mycena metata]
LPNEITARIFILCLSSQSRVKPSPRKAPLLLAQVCRHWREVALSTAALWRSIDMDFKDRRWYSSHLPISTKTRLLQTWLSRAKGSPLFVTV